MDIMNELVWNLQAKRILVHSFQEREKGKQCFINLLLRQEEVTYWKDLIKRLNIVYDQPYQFIRHNSGELDETMITIVFNTDIKDSQKLDKEIQILSQCVINEEYKNFPTNGDRTLDIKLGISCNNNCKHCVIKPNVYKLKENYPESVVVDSGIGMQCSRDLKFAEVIDVISKADEEVRTIVLTGGEPTIRKDIINIVKWIYYNKPYVDIIFQTNGRNLCDMNLVKAIRRYTRNPGFVVAMHGLEKTHNEIVNNRKETGNPFKETIQGIKNLTEIFGIHDDNIRTEIVLSSYNINNLFDTVKFHYEDLGIKVVGISYPHLADYKCKDLKDLTPDLSETLELMKKLNEYALTHTDLKVILEEVPFCIFNQIPEEIRLLSFETRDRSDVSINYIGDQNDDFHTCWVNDHAKFDICKQCLLNNTCIGVWKESKELNEKFIKPVIEISKSLCDVLEANWGTDIVKKLSEGGCTTCRK